MAYNMNKNRLIKLMFIIIVTLQVLGCSSDKNDVLQPDGNRNQRYISVRYLKFSSSGIVFETQTLGSKTVKSFSVSNHERNYPIKFSIGNIPNNITLLDTSTCSKNNATVFPGEDCVYSILLSNNELGEQFDNITFYDNYSEVYLNVSSNVTRGAERSSDTKANDEVRKTSTEGVDTKTTGNQNIELANGNIEGVASASFPLTIDKEYHSFGSADRISKDVSANFVISNRSSSEVNFDISSLSSGGYVIHPISTCTVGTNKLSAFQSCFINIVFSPTSSTIYNDIFHVSYAGEKISVSLTGVGARRYTDINSLQLSDDVIDYGAVVDGEHRTYSVTVKNKSNNSFMRFSLSDIKNGFSYLPSSTCGIYFTTLPPSQSCDLYVRYTSSSNGGSVNIWINNLFKEIKFLSSSIDEDILSIDQSVVDFDNILVNSVNSNIFTLNNISNLDQSLNITSSDDITIINPPTTVVAGSSTDIHFSLQPAVINRDYKSSIKIDVVDGLSYVLPIKAEVVNDSDIDVTQFLSSSSIGEKVYIYDDSMLVYNPLIDNVSNQLHSYNLSSSTWSNIENTGDVQGYGRDAELIFFNDAYYMFGGENKVGDLSDNLSYFDTVNKQWHNIVINGTNIKPSARKGYKGAVVKDSLYIAGGVDSSDNQLGDIWSYDLNRESSGFRKLNIEPLFTPAEINDNSTILLSDNNSIYIVVANKIYSYRIDSDLNWEEKYSIVGADVLENIDIIIHDKVLYLTGSKTGNDKLFLIKLDMITGQTVEIETNISINGSFKSVLQSNNDGLIYLFLMFDDKVNYKLYYLNDVGSIFVEIDTQIYPYIDEIDGSVLYKDYVYSLSSDNKLYSYNLNSKRFKYKSLMSCANISTIITPHIVSDSNSNKLYIIDGSSNMCEYDVELDIWKESTIGVAVGVKDNFSVAMHDNHLWLYGGLNESDVVSDKLWKYNINASLGWVEVTKSPSNAYSNYGVYDHKMVAYGDKLYIAGGKSNILGSKNNSIFKIDLSENVVSMETASILDTEKQLSDSFGIALYKDGFVLLGLNGMENNVLYYDVIGSSFTLYSSLGGDYFDKEYVSKVISFGSSLYIQNNKYTRVSKIILQ